MYKNKSISLIAKLNDLLNESDEIRNGDFSSLLGKEIKELVHKCERCTSKNVEFITVDEEDKTKCKNCGFIGKFDYSIPF